MRLNNIYQIRKILSNLSLSDSEKLSHMKSICDDYEKIEIPEEDKYAKKLSDWISLSDKESDFLKNKAIPTGFADLDKMIGGLGESELIIIGARPAMGKLLLASQIALSISTQHPVLFYSFEEDGTTFHKRMLRTFCRISSFDSSCEIDDDIMRQKSKELTNRQLYISDSAYYRLFPYFKEQLKQEILEHQIKVVIIDSIQFMALERNYARNKDLELAIIMSSLRQIAREQKISIVLLSPINKCAKFRLLTDTTPTLEDLRESGLLDNYADKVILMHRPEYYKEYVDGNGNDLTSVLKLLIEKNNVGETGCVDLHFSNYILRNLKENILAEFSSNSEILIEHEDNLPF